MFVKLLIPLIFYLGLLVWCDTEIKHNAVKCDKKVGVFCFYLYFQEVNVWIEFYMSKYLEVICFLKPP